MLAATIFMKWELWKKKNLIFNLMNCNIRSETSKENGKPHYTSVFLSIWHQGLYILPPNCWNHLSLLQLNDQNCAIWLVCPDASQWLIWLVVLTGPSLLDTRPWPNCFLPFTVRSEALFDWSEVWGSVYAKSIQTLHLASTTRFQNMTVVTRGRLKQETVALKNKTLAKIRNWPTETI